MKGPWSLTGALAGRAVRDEQHEWKLEVDLDYVDWSSFRSSDLTLSTGPTLLLPQDWGTAWVVMFGTEYSWVRLPSLPGWEVAARAGYIHSTTPVPERTFEPVVPDSYYNAFSIGVGFLCRSPGSFLGVLPCGKGIGVDLAYQAVLHDSRRITDNIDSRVIGDWEVILHVGAINLRTDREARTAP